jgi:EAL domain-containing protein (putative c-di-GMP-specific phosphodiesterase class I)
LVRHLVKLCGELKVRTVAKMVETSEIEAVVKAARVDFAQGWLYGRPGERPLGLDIEPRARRKGTVDGWG